MPIITSRSAFYPSIRSVVRIGSFRAVSCIDAALLPEPWKRLTSGLLGSCLALSLPSLVLAETTGGNEQVTITAQGSQPTDSGLSLTVGITPNGDGTTCGTATSVQVLKGTAIDICYTVTNNSTMALAYSTLDDSLDGNLFRYKSTPIPSGASYTWHRPLFRAETSGQHTLTWTAQDIRPQYVPTVAPAAPTDFIDIRSTGILLPISQYLNGSVQTPFPFSFYGITSNAFCIINNGFIVPAVSTSACSGGVVGWVTSLNPQEWQGYDGNHGAVIAPFSTIFVDDSGGVYFQVQGEAPNRKLIVEWDRPARYCDPTFGTCTGTPGRANVEAILGEDGSIAYQYQTTDFLFADPFSGAVYNSNQAVIGLRNGQYGLWNPEDGQFFEQYSRFTTLPYSDPVSITWTLVSPTQLVAQSSANVQVGAPAVRLNPSTLEPVAPSGSSAPVTIPLTITNAGDYGLAWSAGQAPSAAAPVAIPATISGAQPAATEAEPATTAAASFRTARSEYITQSGSPPLLPAAEPAVVAATEQCGPAVPGAMIYDDGLVNNSWYIPPASGAVVAMLQKFTPLSYPATFGSACIAFQTFLNIPGPPGTVSPAMLINFEVVAYDDTGPDGSPGNLLGAVAAPGGTMSVGFPSYETFNNRVDISGLNLRVDQGSIYIGARYMSRQQPQPELSISIGFDDVQDGFLPLTSGGGGPTDTWSAYYLTGTTPEFSPMYGMFYRKNVLAIRAVEAAPGCANPSDVPWLSVSPSVGTVVAGADGSASITFNPTGLADGIYKANVCIGANYGVGASVPISFAIGTPVAKDDTYVVAQRTTLTVDTPGVLANDLDPNGQGLTAVLTGTPQHGSISLQPNGGFTYTPLPGFVGIDSFTYHAVDGPTSNDTTATITVAGDLVFANGFDP